MRFIDLTGKEIWQINCFESRAGLYSGKWKTSFQIEVCL